MAKGFQHFVFRFLLQCHQGILPGIIVIFEIVVDQLELTSSSVWPSLELELVGFFPIRFRLFSQDLTSESFACNDFLWISKSSQVAHLQANGAPGFQQRVSPGVKHRVSPGVRTQGCAQSFFFPMQLARLLRCEMKLVCPDLVRQNNLGVDVLLVFFLCVILISNCRLIFLKNHLVTERFAVCHAQTAVENKHWYPVFLSTAMVRSGLPLPEILTIFLSSVCVDFCLWCLSSFQWFILIPDSSGIWRYPQLVNFMCASSAVRKSFLPGWPLSSCF